MGRLNQSRRQTIGYVYNPMVNNNIKDIQTGRIMSSVQEQAFDYNMTGDGFMDIVRGIFDKGKRGAKYAWKHKGDIAQKAEDIYTSEIGTAVRNLIPDSDDTARPGFAGEKHMLLKLKNGKTGVANYMGPGTEVIKRVRRGDPGRTPADMVAKRHDIDYALAQGQPTKAKQLQAVRDADNRMIRTLKSIAKGAHGGDAQRNIQAGMRLIQAKTIGEDLGLLDKSKFAGDLAKVSDKDKVLLMSNQARLTQQGYGMLPGDELKMKLLKKMVREKKMKSLGDRAKTKSISGGKAKYATSKAPYKTINKNRGASYSKTLPGMKAYKLKGSGLGVAGGQKGMGINLPGGMMMGMGDVMGFVIKGILPKLMKDLGIKPSALPISRVAPIVAKALQMAKSGNIASIIKNLTKTLLPLLAHGKLKTLGAKMSGRGIIDMLKSAKYGLDKKLASGLWSAFKWYINKSAEQQGLKKPFKGSGVNLPGGSWSNFWKGFKKGFTMVFKPGAKLLAPIVGAENPLAGVALGAIGNAL